MIPPRVGRKGDRRMWGDFDLSSWKWVGFRGLSSRTLASLSLPPPSTSPSVISLHPCPVFSPCPAHFLHTRQPAYPTPSPPPNPPLPPTLQVYLAHDTWGRGGLEGGGGRRGGVGVGRHVQKWSTRESELMGLNAGTPEVNINISIPPFTPPTLHPLSASIPDW